MHHIKAQIYRNILQVMIQLDILCISLSSAGLTRAPARNLTDECLVKLEVEMERRDRLHSTNKGSEMLLEVALPYNLDLAGFRKCYWLAE